MIGDQNLDFLWGTLSAFQQSKQQQNALRGPIPSLYVQDTFHATPAPDPGCGAALGTELHAHGLLQPRQRLQHGDFLSNTVSAVYPERPRRNSVLRGSGALPEGSRKTHPGSSLRMSAVSLIPAATVRRLFVQARNWPTTSRTSSPASARSRTRRLPRPSAILQTSTSGPYVLQLPLVGRFHHDQSFPAADHPDSSAGAVLRTVPIHRHAHPVPSRLHHPVDAQRTA